MVGTARKKSDDSKDRPGTAQKTTVSSRARGSTTHVSSPPTEVVRKSPITAGRSKRQHRSGIDTFIRWVAGHSEDSDTDSTSVCSTRSVGRGTTMFVDDEVLYIPFRYVILVCCSLPLGGLILCLFITIAVHFEGATRTHCGVHNYLPSISATIGDYSPERYVWRMCIALHCLPRFVMGFVYRNFYNNSPLRPVTSLHSNALRYLGWMLAILHVIENFMLLLLTCVSSTENHGVHAFAFTSFVLTSQLYMLLNIYLFTYSGRRRSFTNGELSYQYKTFTFGISLLAMMFSVYFYYRHNTYCEPGIYTLFALAEYVVVVSNVFYHSTMIIDFHDKKVSLSSLNSLDGIMESSTTTILRELKAT